MNLDVPIVSKDMRVLASKLQKIIAVKAGAKQALGLVLKTLEKDEILELK